MKINPLQLKDKAKLDKYLRKSGHHLSSLSFVNIFIWKDFFDFFWMVIEKNLCVFAKNSIGCFMYLPPIGGEISSSLIKSCFEIMDKENLDKNISRIENIEEADVEAFKKQNLNITQKDSEYIYKRESLVNLSGDNFKAKRALCNYFVKNYQFELSEFNPQLKNQCRGLYKNWSASRKAKFKDVIFQAMLDDNLKVHSLCFDYYKELGLTGLVVRINAEVKAYSFGYKLNGDTFCILLEVADLSFKGLAQFIFREFCKEMKDFKFINVMDDSGLDNIRQAKLSYHPFKLIPDYIAVRKNA